MKSLFGVLLWLLSFLPAWAQLPLANDPQPERYDRLKVAATPMQLAPLGILPAHIHVEDGHVVAEFSATERAVLDQQGIGYKVLISDMAAYYAARAYEPDAALQALGKTAVNCGNAPKTYAPVQNYRLGNMGGFLTFQEALGIIDSMSIRFPGLVTPRIVIDSSLVTHNGNRVFYIKVSDNAATDEPAETRLLYTGLTHSNEPMGLHNLIYYIYYLLENYGTNPEVTYLLDNTELFFIPMVNPDGYLHNQSTNPNGGGPWRKNRRNNQDGTFGVDLNRNFGYNWGYDNAGSSPNTNSNNYRGPSAFSEAETQSVRALCLRYNFPIALNYHATGNKWIYPWGYIASFQTPDSVEYNKYSGLFTRYNGFGIGTTDQVYGYITNGDSDDWMYGEQTLKPKSLPMTPEIGDAISDGFWPTAANIRRLCESVLYSNLTAAHLVNAYLYVADQTAPYLGTGTSHIRYNYQRYGIRDGATFTVSLTPITANIQSVGPARTYTGLLYMENGQDSIALTLVPGTPAGQPVQFVVNVDNGLFTFRDTLTKYAGSPIVAVADDIPAATNWTGWSYTNTTYHSAPGCMTDSPTGNYGSLAQSNTQLNLDVDLTDAADARLIFWAKWDIATDWDYVQLEARPQGGSWTALCGHYTQNPSQNLLVNGQPLYNGEKDWVEEEISLRDYVGQRINLRFRLFADLSGQADGFYFDDVVVEKVFDITTALSPDVATNGLILGLPQPNPSATGFSIGYQTTYGAATQLVLTDALGREVFRQALSAGNGSVTFPAGTLAPGLYTAQLVVPNGTRSATQKVVVLQ